MNFRKFGIFFIALFLFGFNTVYGSGLPRNRDKLPSVKPVRTEIHPGGQFIKHSDWNFVENRGQIVSSDIKYYGHQGGVYLYCKPGMISFVFTKVEPKNTDQISEATSQPVETQCLGLYHASATGSLHGRDAFNASLQKQISTSRADLVLIGSNPSAQIIASDKQEYYENYYTENTGENGITNIHTYKTITYKSIYPNIDLILHSREEGMKYEFVVFPGGKVSDIQIQWNGLEGIKKNKDFGIEYSCALGNMTESAPYTYQCASPVRADLCVRPKALYSDEGRTKVFAEGRTHGSAPTEKIHSHFILKKNLISFKTGKYDKSKTLVIDPTLEWGTYFGGSMNDIGNRIANDPLGNVYVVGNTLSSKGIATSGAYQSSLSGSNADVFLTKFNSSGALLWATYYGSYGISVNVYKQGLCTDPLGNVYITSYTESMSGMATSSAYQTSYGGGNDDAFLAKFSGSGIRVWATYFGGIGYDLGYGLASDAFGNIYITGYTSSDNNIATNGAYQTSFTGNSSLGYYDAFLAKFSGSGNLLWSTYYGGRSSYGSSGTGASCVSIDIWGNVYITGTTTDLDNIATNGAYQTSFGGETDAFLVKFNSSGSRLWGTYFGGVLDESGYGLSTNALGDVYIIGFTQSNKGIATFGAYETSFGGGEEAFLAKFDSSGAMRWSTYFGGINAEGSGVSSDAAGNAYITGFTGSISGIATGGSYQTSYGGAQDAFLVKFSSSGARLWGTYYGGAGNDYAEGISMDVLGNIYITGYTSSTNSISSLNAYQVNYGGGGDAFIAKFGSYENDAGITAITISKDTICPGLQPIKSHLQNFGTKELNSVQIGLSINGKLKSLFKWIGNIPPDSSITVNLGNYLFSGATDTIKAWASNPNGVLDSFPANDTAISIVYVSALPTATAGPDTTLCYNETYTMQGAGGITYLWTPAKYLSNDTIANPKAVVPNTQLYTLYVSNKYGCKDSANVVLTIKPKLQVKIGNVTSPVCSGSFVSLSATGTGGDSAHYIFDWLNDSIKGNSLNLKINQSGWHTVILTDNCSGLPGKDSVFIDVTPRPKADFTILNRHPYLPDTTFRFQNLSTNASKYLWTFGDSSASNNAIDPVHIYTDSGTYKITLIAYGKCTNDTDYSYIHIFDKYINIYIPDAFSPNGDGVNDVFDIKGLGFVDYNYSIYNRWGELTFETTDTKKSWDGSFKNQPATEGIYVYMISVTDQFGIKHYFSGNLTLMR